MGNLASTFRNQGDGRRRKSWRCKSLTRPKRTVAGNSKCTSSAKPQGYPRDTGQHGKGRERTKVDRTSNRGPRIPYENLHSWETEYRLPRRSKTDCLLLVQVRSSKQVVQYLPVESMTFSNQKDQRDRSTAFLLVRLGTASLCV
jgi:hypothetical protein